MSKFFASSPKELMAPCVDVKIVDAGLKLDSSLKKASQLHCVLIMKNNLFILIIKRYRLKPSRDAMSRYIPLTAVGRHYEIVLNANWR
jgi:hypothetical protein